MLATLLPLLPLVAVHAVVATPATPTTHDARAVVAAGAQVSVSVPLAAPSSAPTLDPALFSFSIEQDRWTDWAGETAPNTFFVNALGNLATRTGTTPVLRIGADSEDHTDFSETVQFSETIFPPASAATPYPEATNITVGQGYYNLASHLPKGTKIVWGVNLGTDNITAATLEARALHTAFASAAVKSAGVSLETVEIGNEPDLYAGNGHRNSSWNIQEYVEQWTEFAASVGPAVGVSSASSAPKFWGCAFGHSSLTDSGFSPESAFSAGLLNSNEGQLIDSISEHNYMGSGATGTLADLMSKAAIRANVSQYDNDIADVHAKGLDYIMGETNSFFNHGAANASDVAGAALWALDYVLFAGVSGIKRMHFHEGIGYKYNLIQPITLTHSPDDNSVLNPPLPPHIQPAYYGAVVGTDTIGTSGAPRIAELSIADDAISGYALFDEGQSTIARVLLINFNIFTTADTTRGSSNVTLTFEGTGATPQKASVKTLEIPHADDKTGITWAGQSFDTSDALPSGSVTTTTLVADAASGSFNVNVEDTQVVLLCFEY